MGASLGIPLWIVTENPGMLAIGIAIGDSIGIAMERAYNKNPRPLTAKEKRDRNLATKAGLVILTLGVIAFLFFVSR